jgi:polysaccharide biosynthesis protein PslH
METVSDRILLVAPWSPVREPQHGGARAVRGIAGALAERHELVLLHLQPEAPVDPELASRCLAVEGLTVPSRGPWSGRARDVTTLARGRSLWAGKIGIGRLQRAIRALSQRWRPDVVQVEYGVLGEGLAAAEPGAVRVLTIYDPASSQREYVSLRREGLALTHRLDSYAAIREERRALQRADAAVVFTDHDRDLVARLSPTAEIAMIPLGWDVPLRALDPAGAPPPSILFIGNFIHPPNVAAAFSLAREIMPLVWRSHPHVRLELVGPSPPPDLRRLANDAVRVRGAVASVTPYLDRAAVFVAPIALGGGIRVKTLEALAAGKAVVASRRAAEGITAKPGRDVIVADGAEGTADAIVALVADEDARRRLAANARSWALRELSWSTTADQYSELYARLKRSRTRSYAASNRGTTASGV